MNHKSNDTQKVKLTGEEVAKHNNQESCWVIIREFYIRIEARQLLTSYVSL